MSENKKQEKKSRLKKFSEQKGKTQYLSNRYIDLGHPDRAQRVLNCANVIEVAQCENGHQSVTQASLCHDRFCPVCVMRRSEMLFAQVSKVVHNAADRMPLRYIFLTLTVRNCPGEELSATLDKLFKGWDTLRRSVLFNHVRGWLRNLEITLDKNNAGFYHPHFHALLAVSPEYFVGNMIHHSSWRDAWREACELDYDPQVRVQAIRPLSNSTTGTSMSAVAAEVGKYAVKDSEYITGDISADNSVLGVLVSTLHHRRLFSWGGLYKCIHKLLNLSDVETDNIDINSVEHCNECRLCGSGLLKQLYSWDFSLSSYFVGGA